jgi:hypothetical protein
MLSTHLFLRSLLEHCIRVASTRAANAETNVAVTQHILPRFLEDFIESRRQPAISFCGALRRILRAMQGLYGGGILLLHTRCSSQPSCKSHGRGREEGACSLQRLRLDQGNTVVYLGTSLPRFVKHLSSTVYPVLYDTCLTFDSRAVSTCFLSNKGILPI